MKLTTLNRSNPLSFLSSQVIQLNSLDTSILLSPVPLSVLALHTHQCWLIVPTNHSLVVTHALSSIVSVCHTLTVHWSHISSISTSSSLGLIITTMNLVIVSKLSFSHLLYTTSTIRIDFSSFSCILSEEIFSFRFKQSTTLLIR